MKHLVSLAVFFVLGCSDTDPAVSTPVVEPPATDRSNPTVPAVAVGPRMQPRMQRYECPVEDYGAIFHAAERDGVFRLKDGQCLAAPVLADLNIAKVGFDVQLSGLDKKCHAFIDLDRSGGLADTISDGAEGAGRHGSVESVELISMLGYPNLLQPPFELSRLSSEVEDAYYDSPYKTAINIVIEEKSFRQGGRIPGRFPFIERADKYEVMWSENVESGVWARYRPKGQSEDDPLIYYNSIRFPERGLKIYSGADFGQRRGVRLFAAWDVEQVHPFTLVDAKRSKNWGKHDVFAKAEQVLPDGTVFIEHGIGPDQLFRMTEIFDITEDYLEVSRSECIKGHSAQ